MDDDQQFCLRWNNHQSTLISVFDTLLEKGIHVDCTLAAEGQTLKAHKVVLSACSPYFESVLSQQYDKHPIIILKDVKFAELRAMMDYMYRGEVNISQDQLAALLKAAESLQIKGLSDSKPPPRASSPTHKARLLDSTSGNNVNNREGSSSPLPRKRRKPRRNSLNDNIDSEMPNNTDNIPSQNHIVNNTTTLTPKPPVVVPSVENDSTFPKAKLNDAIECTPKVKNDISADGIDTKGEICEEGTEDSVEDLTLDEEIDSETEQSGPGPSHPQGDCVQSFSWHMDRAQDESTPSLDGQRDSQAAMKYDESIAAIFNRTVPLTRALLRSCSKIEKPTLQKITRKRKNILSKTVSTKSQNIILRKDADPQIHNIIKAEQLKSKEKLSESPKLIKLDTKPTYKTNTAKGKSISPNAKTDGSPVTDCSGKEALKESTLKSPNVERVKNISPNLPCAQYVTPNGYKCPNCQRTYNARKNLVRHVNLECGREPQHKCSQCSHKTHRRNELKRHMIKKHTNIDSKSGLTLALN